MPDIIIDSAHGPLPAYVAAPDDGRRRPGVVVLHDALGMSEDLRRQADWLAEAGFTAVAPDLYSWAGRMRCMVSVIRSVVRREGRAFDEVEAARSYLVGRPDSTGKVAVIGFCMGGGFAMVLLPSRYGFSAVSANYGGVPKDTADLLVDACPLVASFGGRDRGQRGAAARLEALLVEAGIDHDVKEYPGATHSFMNEIDEASVPFVFRIAGRLTGNTEFSPEATADARRRISEFFHTHLG